MARNMGFHFYDTGFNNISKLFHCNEAEDSNQAREDKVLHHPLSFLSHSSCLDFFHGDSPLLAL